MSVSSARTAGRRRAGGRRDRSPQRGGNGTPPNGHAAASNGAAGSNGGAAGTRLAGITADWRWVAFPVALFLISRVALFLFVHLALVLVPELMVDRPQGPPTRIPVIDGLCRWDCTWFARIARDGYVDPTQTNFFPLLPVLAGFVARATGTPAELGLVLVSNLATLAAFIVLYRLFVRLSDEPAARAGLTLFAAYPFAFFQATGYPESMMILSTALAVLLALDGRHVLAGVVLGFGVLARHLTLLAGVSLLVAQVRQRPTPRRFVLSPSILGLAAPWVALLAYCVFQYLRFDDPFAWYRARDSWGPIAWWGIDELFGAGIRRSGEASVRVVFTYLPFALIVSIAAVALLRSRRWLEIAAFAIVLLIVLWTVGVFGIGRYSASCWPAFLLLGVALSRRPNLLLPTITAFAILQGLYLYLFAHVYPVL